MAENIKNLCAPIPAELHRQLRERQGIKQNAFFLNRIRQALEEKKDNP